MNPLLKITFYSLCATVLFSLIEGIYASKVLNAFVAEYIPLLAGFNWGRISFLNRTLFYVIFACILAMLCRSKYFRILATLIAMLQVIVILTYTSHYSYGPLNFDYKNKVKIDSNVTYNEFFSTDLFEMIKDDLNYNGEKVAAYGYHPSVLMYNGFATIDGYNSFYPLNDMLEFRRIIEPELDRSERWRKYFDSWGGRRYLYSDDLSYQPTRIPADHAVDLYINTEIFAKLGGNYIFSRAEIRNALDINLEYVNTYEKEGCIYRIWAYKVTATTAS
jgi:hypothetical protein